MQSIFFEYCIKIAAVKMTLNGVAGEALCINGLDISGETYRFGYRVEPAIARYPQKMWEYYQMLILMKTGQDIKKQYVLKSIPYEESFLKEANDQLLHEFQERQKIADAAEREKVVKEIEDRIKQRMAGTLFEGDESQLKDIKLPSEKMGKGNVKKKKTSPKNDEQGELF